MLARTMSLAPLALALLLAAAPASAGPPPEGTCPSLQARPQGSTRVEDALPAVLQAGTKLGISDLWRLRELLPEEIWRYRETFFFEGMQMEMGPCHRRYPLPAFFAEATREGAGKAHLDEEGNLQGHEAGLPFPPEQIDPTAPDAGARWAWNLQQRYRGAGPVGSFRLVDMPSRLGSVEVYRGEFFYVQTRHRADLAESDYALPERDEASFVAGGRFTEPFNARHLAWRQLRPAKAERRYQEPDDTFVYVPTMRKMRRSATAWIDGLFTPRYTVGGEAGGGGMPIGTGSEYGVDSIQPTAGLNIAASEDIRRGFTGLVIRPNAYVWRLVGEREVVAPLNGVRPGWPEDPDRNFGPSGLSVADDRWEVRWAVVIEGRARRVVEDVGRVTLYVDYQTQQPLYYIARRPNGLLLDVGILVHRFSGDVVGYPPWEGEGGGLALVFDPVAAVFYSVPEGGAGWRRESYDVVSVPVDGGRLRQMLALETLERRGR
jgi:hypothetical protein